jgi:hypothetical protein
VGLSKISFALGCETFLTAEVWEANTIPHEGFYSNCRFAYAVRLPVGVVGGVSKPHAPDHGIGIRYPEGMISVEGNYNVTDEWISAEAMAKSYVESITRESKQVLSLEEQPVILDGHPAIRLIARFSCSDGTLQVNDYFLIFARGLTYNLNLRTDATKYAEYKPVLEQLAASWQFRAPWCEVVCGNTYPFSPEEWESDTPWGLYSGVYTNDEYGYAVTIPAEFVARGNYKSGVEMLLSRSGYLEVGGGANFLNWSSLDQAAETYGRWITLEAHKVLSSHKQAVTLGGFPAIRLIVRYECPANTPMVKDIFLVLDGDNVYKVDLVAEETKYEEYRHLLEDIAETFRLTGESCE